MSYHVFFSMSLGLKSPLSVPKGTKSACIAHVEEVEKILGLRRIKYLDNLMHWSQYDFSNIESKVLCETVSRHNQWVRKCYDDFAWWSKNPFKKGMGHQAEGPDGAYPIGWKSEKITPVEAQVFWHGFQMFEVPIEKWTREFYTAKMEHLYEVMRGHDSQGVSFNEKALTPRQAAAVVNLFGTYLDSHDCRLDVPKGRDYLASPWNGGYDWCEKCGAVCPDDANQCSKRKCPIREEREG